MLKKKIKNYKMYLCNYKNPLNGNQNGHLVIEGFWLYIYIYSGYIP